MAIRLMIAALLTLFWMGMANAESTNSSGSKVEVKEAPRSIKGMTEPKSGNSCSCKSGDGKKSCSVSCKAGESAYCDCDETSASCTCN